MTNAGENLLSAGVRDVNWLLDKFVADTDGVERAIGVSSDGLLIAISPPLSRAEAEKLAAMISGMTSLALSASRLLSKGPLRQVITEFGEGFLLVSAIRDGSCLGIVTYPNSDLGLVGYASAMLAQRVGALLTPDLITELKTSMIR
ncbi:roadblock/LC7 domain-containing protein [Pseudonocardia aurantiaca]|uniref:Roadblock/LC7 domain-containing protein n=1 Tax=Pseudonocardia aurantiaca TaxID=75290 RepID=A0ABW4FMH1_9PSEU